MRKNNKQQGLAVAVILLFGLVGMKALLHPGLWTAHDIWHNVSRFYWYLMALKDGQILPGWIASLANGYGYPLFFFSYHLPWLVGALGVGLGLDIMLVFKWLYILAYLLSGLTVYGLGCQLFKSKLPAVVVSILYLWAPYHFLSVYVSASVGTVFAFWLLPLLFWGSEKIKADQYKVGLIMIALSLAGIILSHLITVFLVMPFWLIWSIGRVRSKVGWLVGGVLMGVLLSAYYWLPAINLVKHTHSATSEGSIRNVYENYFPDIKQLLYSRWQYGPIVENIKQGEMSVQVGLAQWLAIVTLAGVLLWRHWRERSDDMGEGWWIIGLFVVGCLLMLEVSKPLWKFINWLVVIDFPFRLLLVCVFFGSLAAGWIIYLIKDACWKKTMAILLVVLAIYSNRNHIKVNQYTNFQVNDYVTAELTTNTQNEYFPTDAKKSLLIKPYRLVTGKNMTERLINRDTRGIAMEVTAETDVEGISVGQLGFPGNNLYLDGERCQYDHDIEGLMQINLAKGAHLVETRYEAPLVVTMGKWVSMLSILIMVGSGVYAQAKNNGGDASL